MIAKQLKLFFCTLLMLGSLNTLAAKPEQTTIAHVKVEGMVCSFCAQGVQKTFGSHQSVNTVDVDLDAMTVQLGLKPGKAITEEEIRKGITDAGFEVVKVEFKNQ